MRRSVADRLATASTERLPSCKLWLEAAGTWLVVLCTTTVLATAAAASSLVPDTRGVTSEQIQAALEAVEVEAGLDEATRSRLSDQLRKALTYLHSRQSADATATAYAETLVSAPQETQRLRSKLDEAPGEAPTAESLGIDERTESSVVEGALTSTLVDLAAAEARQSALEAEAAAESDRPARIRQRLAELRAAGAVLNPPTLPVDEIQAIADARRLAFQLEQDAHSAEMRSLEQELLSHGVRLSLLSARRDDVAREIASLRRRVEVLQATVNSKRQRLAAQAREQAELAELAAADEHPAVRALAQANAGLTKELPVLAAEIQRATERIAALEAQAREIEQNLVRSLKRLELGGVNQLLGRLLVEQQRSLPRVSRQRAEMRERRRQLAEASLAQMQREEQRRELAPIDSGVERVLAQVVDVSDPDELRSIRQKVEVLLRNQRDLLQQASSSYASQVSALNEADVAQNRLLEAAADYERFLDRNLLWIPSATVFGWEQIQGLASAAGWLLEPSSWAAALGSMGRALRQSLLGTLGALLALGLGLVSRRGLAAVVASTDLETDRTGQAPGIRQTLGALSLAALQALPWPFLLAVLGWALHRSTTVDGFAAAVGAAFLAVAPFLYNTLLLKTLGAEDGALRVHFGWQGPRLALLRRQANHLTWLGGPLSFVSALAYGAPITLHGESLGRLTFVLLMLLVGGVGYALLHPARGLWPPPDDAEPAHPLLRVAHVTAVAVPILLALASLLGYTYTAFTLARHWIDTYWLGFGLYLLRLVAWRWLTVAGRHLRKQAREAEPQLATGTASATVEPEETEPEEAGHGVLGEAVIQPSPAPDLETVDRQSKRLLDAAFAFVGVLLLWAIWSDIVPALGVFDRTSLWQQTVSIDGKEATIPVTLADLLLAFLIVGVTAIAARNLPGLMEIAILQRLTLQPGGRYAINTLLRYVIVLVGTIATFSVLGWRWSQIQWLAAAISVGLGFGLQEIVANFVSGLIILFERPVRIGDTVTVGQVTGSVSRVRIRATTITDWDRKEIVVPNKALITEQVINWTLTDAITRIVVPVGIGYGSDVEKAKAVLAETLAQLPLVLDEPAPRVYFVGFGESSLDFTLHVYARRLSDRLPLTHAVHEAVLRALREHDMEIPFPQRDLHMK